MRPSLERLEAFVAAARAGSFSAAARSLGKAQSSLSGAISQLEIELGVELFDRTTRIPTLTVAGERLLLSAQTVTDRMRMFEAEAEALTAGTSGSLAISVNVPMRMLARPIREFAERYPLTDLVVQAPVGERRIADDVLRDEAAIGVALAEPDYPRSLAFRRLGTVVMVHVAHRDHPLARRGRVSFADLREHRRLVYADRRPAQPTSEYLQSAHSWRLYDYGALVELTRAAVGWATVPRQFILDELRSGEFVELRLTAYQHTDWLVGVDLIHRREGPVSEQELWLRERLSAHRVFEQDTQGSPTPPSSAPRG
jgi:DNA-binding transcriptional LysR family regulator